MSALRAQLANPPVWLILWGVLAFPGTIYLVGRLVWEQTLLTWQHGPQMVGYSLIHTGPVRFLLLSLLMWVVLIFALIARLVYRLFKKRRISFASLVALILSISLIGILLLPYSFWQRLFAGKLVHGPYVAEFYAYAAATGDVATVRAFTERGVNVNIRTADGATALYGAAVEGQTKIIKYLLSKGADPDIRSKDGQTALAAAREGSHPEAAEILKNAGGNE
jgi:hypothetical protein